MLAIWYSRVRRVRRATPRSPGQLFYLRWRKAGVIIEKVAPLSSVERLSAAAGSARRYEKSLVSAPANIFSPCLHCCARCSSAGRMGRVERSFRFGFPRARGEKIRAFLSLSLSLSSSSSSSSSSCATSTTATPRAYTRGAGSRVLPSAGARGVQLGLIQRILPELAGGTPGAQDRNNNVTMAAVSALQKHSPLCPAERAGLRAAA